MHSSPTAHGAAHTPHASGRVGSGQHIVMRSVARPELMGGRMGRKDPVPLNSPLEQQEAEFS